MTQNDYIVFGAPQINDAEIEEIVATMKSGWLGTGPRVHRFEQAFSAYTGAEHAMAVNSCTAALHLAMTVSGVGPGDEVITTPLTFAATANSIIHTGATPVFADIDPETLCIDPAAIEAAITSKTRAIVPVHFGGRPCDLDAIQAICNRHDLMLIEDAAHCIEGIYHGKKIGSIGDITCFSFYVTKNVVTGEGGMVTTDNPEFAEKVKQYALHGMTKDAWSRFSDDGYKHYQVIFPGFKYNMMDLQAAIGIHQLDRVEVNLAAREAQWERYDEALSDLPLRLPAVAEPNTRHARHLYAVQLQLDAVSINRDQFLTELHNHGVGTGVHYIPVHEHPYYEERFGFTPDDFPHAAEVGRSTLSLPLSPKLSEEDQNRVIAAIRECLA